MNRIEKADTLFMNHFNCAQAVFAVFSTELGLDEDTALKVGACFGGGARQGELCGAVSGALMAIGLKYGSISSEDLDSKAQANAKAQAFEQRFIESNGSLVCRDLLEYDLRNPEELNVIMEKNLFKTICPLMVKSSVKILEEML